MRHKKTWYRFDYLSESGHEAGCGLSPSSSRSRHTIRGEPLKSPPQRRMVAAGKTSAAYNAHSYPTKIPPEAIEPYIEHFTNPGEIVLDPFCGSGMTGLAAQRQGRRVVLNDLSPLAVHLAFNHATPCDPASLKLAWKELRARLAQQESRHYGISCTKCSEEGTIRYTIWSDVYRCLHCRAHTSLWRDAVDHSDGRVPKMLRCHACGEIWPRSAAHRVRVEPAWVVYKCKCRSGLLRRAPTSAERDRALAFPALPDRVFVPKDEVGSDREMYQRSALHLRGVRTVADLYTPRNLSALAVLWDAIGTVADARIRNALAFAFTNTAWHGTRMRRYNARGGHRPLTGTLFIPQLSSEANVFEVLNHKVGQLARFYAEMSRDRASGTTPPAQIHLGSATDLPWLGSDSVDYIFTDPPFGSNIFYADCNLVSEAWLGATTDTELEAVVNRSRGADQGGKSLDDYRLILTAAFQEMHRVLRPGRWATVVFQSSDGAVWHAIEQAATGAGFEVHSADMLDKVQQSMKGYKGRSGKENVASFDIVLHLHKLASLSSRQESSQRTSTQLNGRRLLSDAHAQRQIVVRAVRKHLEATSAASERTLPFLYSLSIRALLNSGVSIAGFSIEGLRALLSRSFEERHGRWYPLPRATALA